MNVGNMAYFDAFHHVGAGTNLGDYAILCLIVRKYTTSERNELNGWVRCDEDVYDIMFDDKIIIASQSMLIEI